jgi:hypothetical protein
MVEGEPPPGAGAAGVASMMGAGTKAAARPEIEREEKHVPRQRSALLPPLSSSSEIGMMVVGGGGVAAPLPCARGDEMKRKGLGELVVGLAHMGVDRDVSRAGGVRLSDCKKTAGCV